MAIERQSEPGLPVARNPLFRAVLERFTPSPNTETTEREDGSVVVDFDPEATRREGLGHNSNLAEVISDDDLRKIAGELVELYDADRASRKDWEKTYIEGLDLLGLKFEERDKPWAGAAGVFHPLLAESVIRFQSQTIQEIFPASGPAKIKVEGAQDEERLRQAHRAVNYLNYLSTEEMTEYRSETEKLLFSLPLAGSAFRKVYQDPNKGRQCAMFVPAEDFVVSYGALNLETCERATHVMKMTPNQIKRLQLAGYYRDIELPKSKPQATDIERKYSKMKGEEEEFSLDSRHTTLEMLVDYDMPGFEHRDAADEISGLALPYVVSIDYGSKEILAIRRNWRERDPLYKRRDHFVHYEYLPGLGFYGFGLVHIIGGLAKTATSLLRQLIDAGTLSNLPGGLKTRGMRIKGDDSPIMPGEFRDVDVPGDRLRDNITFLPYKEPSTVLYQLLGDVVQEGRRFASAADMKAADMNTEAPVGTTLAILEREMKVMSAIQARIHAAMGKELRILAGLVAEHGPEKYPYLPNEEFSPRQDFDERVDVIPVSDPNAGTMAQRIMQHQAAIQLAGTAPELYDMPFLHRQMLETLGIQNSENIVPLEDDMLPVDPVTENMALLNSKPVKAHLYQDHEAHIQVHMAMGQDPRIQEMMEKHPNAKQIMQAGAAHISEHLAFAYRQQVEQELGAPLPGPEEPLPEDIELRLSRLVAPAAAQVTGKAQAMQQAEENAKRQEDPIVKLQERKLAIEERGMAVKEQEARGRASQAMERLRKEFQEHVDRLELEHRKLDEKRDETAIDAAVELADKEARQQIEGFREGVRMVERAMDRMNKEAD